MLVLSPAEAVHSFIKERKDLLDKIEALQIKIQELEALTKK